MKLQTSVVLMGLALAGANTAYAVDVTSYDVAHAQASGYGGWSHTYTGSIASDGLGTQNYTGGGGTLNDGLYSTDHTNNQLFTIPSNTSITLYLSSTSNVSGISIFGGDYPANAIPGMLTGWSVTIGGVTTALASTAFGPNCSGALCNDSVSLLGTGLESIATNTVVLSNFQGGWADYYNATEITVSAIAVPEPESYAMLLAGLLLVGTVVRRRQAKG